MDVLKSGSLQLNTYIVIFLSILPCRKLSCNIVLSFFCLFLSPVLYSCCRKSYFLHHCYHYCLPSSWPIQAKTIFLVIAHLNSSGSLSGTNCDHVESYGCKAVVSPYVCECMAKTLQQTFNQCFY